MNPFKQSMLDEAARLENRSKFLVEQANSIPDDPPPPVVFGGVPMRLKVGRIACPFCSEARVLGDALIIPAGGNIISSAMIVAVDGMAAVQQTVDRDPGGAARRIFQRTHACPVFTPST